MLRPRRPQGRTALVTGASSGIGRSCARRLARRGFRVFGTYLPGEHPEPLAGVRLLPLNVDDDTSVAACVATALGEAGRIDVLVNNAGFGIAGSIEETSLAELKAQMETNFFGTARMCRAVLPGMRARGTGTIVNVSSIGGIIALPFQGAYSAAKFAVEGFTEALRMEVSGRGIRVALVEPADIRTGFTDARRKTAASTPSSPYAAAFERALDVIEADERGGSSPEAVARVVARVAGRANPRLRYMAGAFDERLAVFVKRLVPGRWFEPIIRAHYRIRS